MPDTELVERLANCLKGWMPVIEVHVEATHLFDGFNRRKNHWDCALKRTKALLKAALKAVEEKK